MPTKPVILLVTLAMIIPAVSASEEFKFGLVAYHVPFESYKLTEEDFVRIADNGMTGSA